MKNNHSIKVAAFALGLFVISASAGFACLSSDSGKVQTAPLINRKSALNEAAFDPSTYEEVSSALLAPEITGYTSTSLSRHLNVQFKSKAITAFRGRRLDVFSVIDDPNFSENLESPFVELQDDNYLDGFIYQAKVSGTSGETMYFPYEMTYGGKGAKARFIIQNKRIAENCMSAAEDYNGLTTVYIFSGIDTIDSKAFTNVPAGVTFKCEDAAKPSGWADDWTDAANVSWGVALSSTDAKEGSLAITGTSTLGSAKDFILGYKGNNLEGEEHIDAYPLTLAYEVSLADSSVETRYQQIPTKHLTNLYDAVGSNIYGNTNNFEITVDVGMDEEIVDNSYRFYNIFNAKKVYTEERISWPIDKVNEVRELYGVSEFNFPTLDGNDYAERLYETSTDKYLTIHAEKGSEDDAVALVNQYKGLIEEYRLGELSYELLSEEYKEDTYGYVYRLDFEENESKYAAFVQIYNYENHFITYLFLDKLVSVEETKTVTDEETGDEKEVTETVIKLSRSIPISAKKEAERPFYFAPDLAAGKLFANSVIRYSEITDVGDIFDLKYKQSSSFGGYASVSMTLDKRMTTAYYATLADNPSKKVALLKNEDETYQNGSVKYTEDQVNIIGNFQAPEVYIRNNISRGKVENNIDTIYAGSIVFRYTLTNFNVSSLVVKYRSGNDVLTKLIPISSPSPVVEIVNDKNNDISFLVDKAQLNSIATDNILALGITGLTVNVHLYNSTTKTVVQNTALLNVFGNIEVLPFTGNHLSYFNIDLYLILFFAALLVVYAIGTIILFLYKKNKYKNDEFRRMRPKAFFKSAAFGFIGLALVSAAINFIVLRFAVFSSSVPVSNPIDPFVIVFGLAGAIALGLFIRALVVFIKLEKKRREAQRLHLDKDVAEDGTN